MQQERDLSEFTSTYVPDSRSGILTQTLVNGHMRLHRSIAPFGDVSMPLSKDVLYGTIHGIQDGGRGGYVDTLGTGEESSESFVVLYPTLVGADTISLLSSYGEATGYRLGPLVSPLIPITVFDIAEYPRSIHVVRDNTCVIAIGEEGVTAVDDKSFNDGVHDEKNPCVNGESSDRVYIEQVVQVSHDSEMEPLFEIVTHIDIDMSQDECTGILDAAMEAVKDGVINEDALRQIINVSVELRKIPVKTR